MIELLDIYNSNKEKTGRICERGITKLANYEYYLFVRMWIINSKGEILLTQRAMDKKNGGKWEATGGCVETGETSVQARIEN